MDEKQQERLNERASEMFKRKGVPEDGTKFKIRRLAHELFTTTVNVSNDYRLAKRGLDKLYEAVHDFEESIIATDDVLATMQETVDVLQRQKKALGAMAVKQNHQLQL